MFQKPMSLENIYIPPPPLNQYLISTLIITLINTQIFLQIMIENFTVYIVNDMQISELYIFDNQVQSYKNTNFSASHH